MGCMSNEKEDEVDGNDYCSKIYTKRNTSEQSAIASSRYDGINDDNGDDLESSAI